MENKYLWIFVPNWGGGEPFPLFWSDRNIGFCNVENLDEPTIDKIKYLFSDTNKDYREGYVISWSYLNLLDDEQLLSELS